MLEVRNASVLLIIIVDILTLYLYQQYFYYRQRLNIPLSYAIDKKETVNKYQKIQKENQRLTRELKETENKLVTVELENRNLILKTKNLVKVLTEMGYQSEKIDEICDDDIPQDSGIDSSR